MPVNICFEIYSLTLESLNIIDRLCLVNKQILNNNSILSYNKKLLLQHNSCSNDELKIFSLFQNLIRLYTTIIYSTYDELDLLLCQEKIRIWYCFSPELYNISNLPSYTSNCLHGLIVNDDNSNTKLAPSLIHKTLSELSIEQITNATDNELSALFKLQFIDPALNICNHTLYQQQDGFSVLFVGSTNINKVSLIKINNPITNANNIINNELSNLSNEHKPKNCSNSAILSIRNIVDKIKNYKNIINHDTGKPLCKINIKLSCNWTDNLLNDWKIMLPEHLAQFFEFTSNDPDYWIIINAPYNNICDFVPSRTIVLRMEPYIDNILSYNSWLNNTNKFDFLFFLDNKDFLSGTEWWSSLPYDKLINSIDKTNTSPSPISAVVSKQYNMEGHKLRIDFIKYFQSHSSIQMDIFGFDNYHNLKNYRGSLPYKNKDNGIHPYKYHFAAENSAIDNYITEKLYDAILGECLLFYWGSPTVIEHIDSRAFIMLNLHDHATATKVIEDAINNNEWNVRLPFIKREKERIMYHLNFWARIPALIYTREIEFYYINKHQSPVINIPGINLKTIMATANIKTDEITNLLFSYICPTIQIPQLGRMIDHYRLLKQCVEMGKTFCILEDVPKNHFLDHLTVLLASPNKWDIIFLNWNHPSDNTEIKQRNILTPLTDHIMKYPIVIENNPLLYHGNIGHGYIIKPECAKYLLRIIDDHGFWITIDEWLLLCINALNTTNRPLLPIIPWTNLITINELPVTEQYHVFRHDDNGGLNNGKVHISYPEPIKKRKIQLISESQLNTIITTQ